MKTASSMLISSISELREVASSWDDLWNRSSVAIPLARAEMVAQWVERFQADGRFYAIVVEKDGRYLAALPLVETKKAKFISAGANPSNAWSMCGQLLIDMNENSEEIMEELIAAFRLLPFHILWLDYVRFDDAEWKLFREVLAKKGIMSHWKSRYSTGILVLDRPFDELSLRWKKKEICNIRRRIKKFFDPERTVFRFSDQTECVERLLPECFELENRGWKGQQGSIILKNMEQFYLNQARYLCENGMLRIYSLHLDEKLVAFQYALFSKSSLFSQKISYDPACRQMAPSQSLRYMEIEQLSLEGRVTKMDFVGEMKDFHLCWNPQESINGQIVLPLSSFVGKSFFFLYDTIMPWVRKRREKRQLLQKEPNVAD